MQDDPIYISLIDLVPIHIALANPQGGGLWNITRNKRQEGTGRDVAVVEVQAGTQLNVLRFSGPTMTGLSDAQLRIEFARLERIRAAAEQALEAIDAHLTMRHAPMPAKMEQGPRALWADYIRREPEAIRIEVESGGRYVVVSFEKHSEVIARDYGGAIYHMGQQIRWPSETVRAWRSSSRPDLHAHILETLVELGFPEVPLEPLYPGERPSGITLRHRNGASASIMAPSRFYRSSPALQQIEREIDAICYATQTTPSTHTVPNPDA